MSSAMLEISRGLPTLLLNIVSVSSRTKPVVIALGNLSSARAFRTAGPSTWSLSARSAAETQMVVSMKIKSFSSPSSLGLQGRFGALSS